MPMKTEDGSENGEIRDDYYFTEEIKVCPKCLKRVRESYCAELIHEIREK